MRFLIIGDIHCYGHMVTAAIETVGKTGKLDAVIGVGDLTNSGEQMELEGVKSAVDIALSSIGCAGAPYITCMGNHDYGNKPHSDEENAFYRARFESVVGHPPCYCTTVDGYTFIAFSARNHWATITDEDYAWLEDCIITAERASDYPIFVMTHYSTVGDGLYGGQDGATKLTEIIGRHPRVIHLSGHSHGFLANERSFLQSESGYHVMNCGSLWQAAAHDNIKGSVTGYYIPIVTVAETDGAKVTLRRMDAVSGDYVGEAWHIGDVDNTFAARAKRAEQPQLCGDLTASSIGQNAILLTFSQASGECEKYRAKAMLCGESVAQAEYSSRYFMPYEGNANVELCSLSADTEYDIELTAVNFFGGESEPLRLRVKTAAELKPYDNTVYSGGIIAEMWQGDTEFIREGDIFGTDSDALMPYIETRESFDFSGGFSVFADNYRNRYNNVEANFSAVSVGDFTAVTSRDKAGNTMLLLDGYDLSVGTPIDDEHIVASVRLPHNIEDVTLGMTLYGDTLAVWRDKLPVITRKVDITRFNNARIGLRLGETWGVFKNCGKFSKIEIKN